MTFQVVRITTLLSLGAVALNAVVVSEAVAGPWVCTSSLEAPPPAARPTAPVTVTPVTVTHCLPVEHPTELIERRFFSWTAPYDRGVDVVHQLTDLLGLAVAGENGTRLMGLGFPDQTVSWDAAAVGATSRALIEEQSPAMPMRTRDLANGFGSSLAVEVAPVQSLW